MNSAGDGLIAIMTCYGLGGSSHEHSIIRILVAQAATKDAGEDFYSGQHLKSDSE